MPRAPHLIMGEACNDNGREGVRVLEARFHPGGVPDDFVVIGKIVCRNAWASLEVAPGLDERVPGACSAESIISNLTYLTVMSRPRPFVGLLSLENRFWSFVVAE